MLKNRPYRHDPNEEAFLITFNPKDLQTQRTLMLLNVPEYNFSNKYIPFQNMANTNILEYYHDLNRLSQNFNSDIYQTVTPYDYFKITGFTPKEILNQINNIQRSIFEAIDIRVDTYLLRNLYVLRHFLPDLIRSKLDSNLSLLLLDFISSIKNIVIYINSNTKIPILDEDAENRDRRNKISKFWQTSLHYYYILMKKQGFEDRSPVLHLSDCFHVFNELISMLKISENYKNDFDLLQGKLVKQYDALKKIYGLPDELLGILINKGLHEIQSLNLAHSFAYPLISSKLISDCIVSSSLFTLNHNFSTNPMFDTFCHIRDVNVTFSVALDEYNEKIAMSIRKNDYQDYDKEALSLQLEIYFSYSLQNSAILYFEIEGNKHYTSNSVKIKNNEYNIYGDPNLLSLTDRRILQRKHKNPIKIAIIDTGYCESYIDSSRYWLRRADPKFYCYHTKSRLPKDDTGHGSRIYYIIREIAKDSEITVIRGTTRYLERIGQIIFKDQQILDTHSLLNILNLRSVRESDLVNISLSESADSLLERKQSLYPDYRDSNLSRALDSLIEELYDQNPRILILCASGNDSAVDKKQPLNSPSSARGIITVCSNDAKGNISHFSNVPLTRYPNYKRVISTLGHLSNWFQEIDAGTSYSCAIATGILAERYRKLRGVFKGADRSMVLATLDIGPIKTLKYSHENFINSIQILDEDIHNKFMGLSLYKIMSWNLNTIVKRKIIKKILVTRENSKRILYNLNRRIRFNLKHD
ncbi:hypothetical protein DC3_40760 [Deinococcus cellulosilyticus NBRC 106333 = KACC 11606]|uniref:Peptidase S8/S53 domain-containing protein n=2 Tax=Deinococcus cellulosilyticus TaxID=401558 RepID=A0A511N7Q0_DEIC1|nr:hypothetical protein DC3_40760 [Deinococcus cellulosilyticus NBRC 106333 = KACC 11606]